MIDLEKKRGFLLWFLLEVAALCGTFFTAAAGQFVVISDLHYLGNAEHPRGFSQDGEDSNRRLVKATLDDIKKHCKSPMFILCLGDFYAHNTFPDGENQPRAPINQAEAELAELLRSNFPTTTIFPVLGNNDSNVHDEPPQKAFLHEFASLWAPLIRNQADSSNFYASFSSSGCFAAALPGLPHHRILGFDSSCVSAKNTDLPSLASQQLDWLDMELRSAVSGNQTVWMMCHIPPGLNPHVALTRLTSIPFWRDNAQSRFLGIWSKYATNIAICFCGHTHMDDFRLVYAGQKTIGFIHIAPAVSPCYGNNPAYQIFDTDAQGNIADYHTWYLTNLSSLSETVAEGEDKWREEYSFSSAYKMQKGNYNLATVRQLLNTLATGQDDASKTARSNFVTFYCVGNTNAADLQPDNFESRFLELMTIPTASPIQ